MLEIPKKRYCNQYQKQETVRKILGTNIQISDDKTNIKHLIQQRNLKIFHGVKSHTQTSYTSVLGVSPRTPSNPYKESLISIVLVKNGKFSILDILHMTWSQQFLQIPQGTLKLKELHVRKLIKRKVGRFEPHNMSEVELVISPLAGKLFICNSYLLNANVKALLTVNT